MSNIHATEVPIYVHERTIKMLEYCVGYLLSESKIAKRAMSKCDFIDT